MPSVFCIHVYFHFEENSFLSTIGPFINVYFLYFKSNCNFVFEFCVVFGYFTVLENVGMIV